MNYNVTAPSVVLGDIVIQNASIAITLNINSSLTIDGNLSVASGNISLLPDDALFLISI